MPGPVHKRGATGSGQVDRVYIPLSRVSRCQTETCPARVPLLSLVPLFDFVGIDSYLEGSQITIGVVNVILNLELA